MPTDVAAEVGEGALQALLGASGCEVALADAPEGVEERAVTLRGTAEQAMAACAKLLGARRRRPPPRIPRALCSRTPVHPHTR